MKCRLENNVGYEEAENLLKTGIARPGYEVVWKGNIIHDNVPSNLKETAHSTSFLNSQTVTDFNPLHPVG